MKSYFKNGIKALVVMAMCFCMMVSVASAYSNTPPAHGWIALQAFYLLPSGDLKNEMSNFLSTDPNSDFYNVLFGDKDNTTKPIPDSWIESIPYFELNVDKSLPTALIEGAWEEDGEGTGELKALNHFWNPDTYENQYNDGLFKYDSALKTALEGEFDGAIGARFKNAIDAYYNGSKADAYYWLGRTAHLLMDMTVPEHVHLDSHNGSLNDGDSSYEKYVARFYKNVDVSNLSPPPFDMNNSPLQLPDSYKAISVPDRYDGNNADENKLAKLFYNVAQYTQLFPSDDEIGDNKNALIYGAPKSVTIIKAKGAVNVNDSFDSDKEVKVSFVFTDSDHQVKKKPLTKDIDFSVNYYQGKIYGSPKYVVINCLTNSLSIHYSNV